jgi:hypothetical protein
MQTGFILPDMTFSFAIGSYTFAKTLEYKAKQGLNSGKDVTVIPPIEYQDRFVRALDGYFLACPGIHIALMMTMMITSNSCI